MRVGYRTRYWVSRIISFVIVTAFIWMFITVAQLEDEHIVMCANVAQTPFAISQNWGC